MHSYSQGRTNSLTQPEILHPVCKSIAQICSPLLTIKWLLPTEKKGKWHQTGIFDKTIGGKSVQRMLQNTVLTCKGCAWRKHFSATWDLRQASRDCPVLRAPLRVGHCFKKVPIPKVQLKDSQVTI